MHLDQAKPNDVVIVESIESVPLCRHGALRALGVYEMGVLHIDGACQEGVRFHKDAGPITIPFDEAARIEVRKWHSRSSKRGR